MEETFDNIDYRENKMHIQNVIFNITLIAIIILSISMITNQYTAANYAQENTMTEQLISGTFDTRNDINNSASNFFTKMAGKIFSIALPFMSAFTLTMTTLSLISSIIYFTKPDLFEEVHELVQRRKGNTERGVSGFVNYYKQSSGLREFLLSYLPDFKSWAFQDSVTAGADGEPTFQDFFRNMPKYIAMITFGILIVNRVLLDFLMTGAVLTATLAEKVTYDYDYVSIMENFLDQGKKYKPQQWTGKGRENANKMTVYRQIYNSIHANLAPEQKDTESLQSIGMAVEEYMMTHIIPNEHWDRKVFSARTEYIPVRRTNVDVPGTYYISGADVGMLTETGSPGYVMLYIRSESDDTSFAATGSTRYPGAWGQGTPPTSFDLKAIPGVQQGNNITYEVSGGTAFVVLVDGEAYNARVDLSEAHSGIIKIDYSGLTGVDLSQVKTVTISGLRANTIRTVSGDQTIGGAKNPITFDKPVWINPDLHAQSTTQDN